jgi:thiamine pyrophosphokinase
MTDLLLVLLINFFALYTTSQYLAVLKKEEQFGKYVSFFTVGGDVSGLTLKGFKYPLDGYDLTVADSGLTVSNEIVSETAEVTYDRGSLLMIMSRD